MKRLLLPVVAGSAVIALAAPVEAQPRDELEHTYVAVLTEYGLAGHFNFDSTAMISFGKAMCEHQDNRGWTPAETRDALLGVTGLSMADATFMYRAATAIFCPRHDWASI